METADRLQRRIEGLRDLQSIVRTMKALAAVSIRQYEEAVRSLDDYYRTVRLGLSAVLQRSEMAAPRGEGRQAAVVFGSDQGLCGRFNENIVQRVAVDVPLRGDGIESPILAVGARCAAELERNGYMVEEDFMVPGSASRITATVQRILLKMDEWTTSQRVTEVRLFYNCRVDSANYQPAAFRLLPLEPQALGRESPKTAFKTVPMFTMEPQRLLTLLLRQYLFVSVFRACAESLASEHGSRLAAMQNAESNLEETLEEVSTRFRRVRQENITSELLDVVAGFEASAPDQT